MAHGEMDASEEEGDVKLQRASADLLANVLRSLPPFLWQQGSSGAERIRRSVRIRERDRLVMLLEPFQELPQLLDPHLAHILPVLADAFLVCLQSKKHTVQTDPKLLMPLQAAICSLLYTVCKIRGEKVVVRFFGTEVRYLELLLSAVEKDGLQLGSTQASQIWTWEERYITLLWLSQLLLVPFDLASLSSQEVDTDIGSRVISNFAWPANLPSIASRVLSLAIYHLAASGKERDAAKVLLVRVVTRSDMQELGVLNAMVQWALACLRPPSAQRPLYYYIGVLDFLAGLLMSSDFAAVGGFLHSIVQTIQQLSNSASPFSEFVQASAVSRKIIIKILRNIALLYLQGSATMDASEVVESVIGHMLESLADAATPVRLAASKALSIITLKLAPDMALQVIEAVLDALKQGVPVSEEKKPFDLSKVNASEWHGLIMTLSHLVYRRSPPMNSLQDIVAALLTALSFEQRSATGATLGTNVRDAACYGIWGLARRYTTTELQAVEFQYEGESAVLQVTAKQLITAASLDPEGNIRRGASAALQELIGRHPDMIIEGINVVQVVDYHAVALRSSSFARVAYGAAQLSRTYQTALLQGLLEWRGIGDADAVARKHAATAFGRLVWCEQLNQHETWAACSQALGQIKRRLESLRQRQMDERHGLILCQAAVMASSSSLFGRDQVLGDGTNSVYLADLTRQVIDDVSIILQDALETIYRRPELLAEAVCDLLVASFPFIQLDLAFRAQKGSVDLLANYDVLDPQSMRKGTFNSMDVIRYLRILKEDGFVPQQTFLRLASEFVAKCLHRRETEVMHAASRVALGLLELCDDKTREKQFQSWIQMISTPNRGNQGHGFIHAVFAALPLAGSLQSDLCTAVEERWRTDHDIETRCTILQGLQGSNAVLSPRPPGFVDLIAEGLNDYTTNARGDVGSLVRIEGIRAAAAIGHKSLRHNDFRDFQPLFVKLLRLAAEKLDKVRIEAQQAIAIAIHSDFQNIPTGFESQMPSSQAYFKCLLRLRSSDCLLVGPYDGEWFTELLEGYVSSADTGSEEVVKHSRAALADFCEEGHVDLVCASLMLVVKRNLGNDRVLVPALEVMGFLFDVQLLQQSSTSWRNLYSLVQKAHYKTGNVKKLEVSIKLYGGLVEVYPQALEKLSSMLLHPYPKVRNQVADTLFIVRGVGKGVDWIKASKTDLAMLRRELLLESNGR